MPGLRFSLYTGGQGERKSLHLGQKTACSEGFLMYNDQNDYAYLEGDEA